MADNAINAAVAGHIDTESILTFFHSDLGRLVLDAEKNAVRREWPFTFALPASFVARDPSLVARTTSHELRTTKSSLFRA